MVNANKSTSADTKPSQNYSSEPEIYGVRYEQVSMITLLIISAEIA